MKAALEAFEGVETAPMRNRCHRCGSGSDERVNVGLRAIVTTGRTAALASFSRSFCPPCAREVFDEAKAVLER